MFISYVFTLLYEFVILCYGGAELIHMRIVDEPAANVAWNSGQRIEGNQLNQLTARAKPANISGPLLFRRLYGKCFTANITLYEYTFCPFGNVTQKELGNTWMPYHGILGIWQEWDVTNYTFSAQLYKEGDDCGNIQRSVKVTFLCGPSEKIVNMTEPMTCQYHMTFVTRLVCHRDTLLVYPTLTELHQREWDELEGQWNDGQLTHQGYKKRLRHILEGAGYMLSSSARTTLLRDAQRSYLRGFSSIAECQLEYEKLQEEVLQLRERLADKSKSGPVTTNIPVT